MIELRADLRSSAEALHRDGLVGAFAISDLDGDGAVQAKVQPFVHGRRQAAGDHSVEAIGPFQDSSEPRVRPGGASPWSARAVRGVWLVAAAFHGLDQCLAGSK